MSENGYLNGNLKHQISKDHDLLISLNQNVSQQCKDIKEVKVVLDKVWDKLDNLPCHSQFRQCEERFDNIDKEIAKKPNTNTLIRNSISIIVVLLGIFGGIIGYNFSIDEKQDKKIDMIEQELIEHKIEAAENQ